MMHSSEAMLFNQSDMHSLALMSMITSVREEIAELGSNAPFGAIRGLDIAVETLSRYGASRRAADEMKARASNLEGFDCYRNQCSDALRIAAILCNLLAGT